MIQSVKTQFLMRQAAKAASGQEDTKSQGIGPAKEMVSGFQKMFDEVNKAQITADHKMNQMVAGETKDIPGTMIAMEKADVSLRMFMAVRNKLVRAYEDMMRMQV